MRSMKTAQGSTSLQNESMNRVSIAEEVTRAIQATMPAFLEQINENTRKMIDDRVRVAEKEKNQITESTCEMTENRVVVETSDISEFMPNFNGVRDPIVAMTWIYDMENIFRAIECADEDKVVYAVPMLKFNAEAWWEGEIKEKRGPDAATKMTWSEFKEVFKEAYCPISMAIELEDEFLTLKQGNQTVQEYSARVMELAWFVENLLPPLETRKIYRFVQGLKANVREFVNARYPNTFQTAVELAKEFENGSYNQVQERNTLKRKWEGSENRICITCGQSHGGECRYGSKSCYQCDEIGHEALECDHCMNW